MGCNEETIEQSGNVSYEGAHRVYRVVAYTTTMWVLPGLLNNVIGGSRDRFEYHDGHHVSMPL